MDNSWIYHFYIQLKADFEFPLKELATMTPNMFTADKMSKIDTELKKVE